MVCLRNMCVDTLHKGENNDDDNNNLILYSSNVSTSDPNAALPRNRPTDSHQLENEGQLRLTNMKITSKY